MLLGHYAQQQVLVIFIDIEASSRGTDVHDQPMAIHYLGNLLNWQTPQRKR